MHLQASKQKYQKLLHSQHQCLNQSEPYNLGNPPRL